MFLCKPRGRPRAYDPDTVLDRAADLFWRKGFAATTLDDLVAATGVNRPSLYAGFGDKESIYLKAMARVQQVFAEKLASVLIPLHDDESLADIFTRYFALVIDLYVGKDDEALGCPFFCTAVTEAAASEPVQAMLAAVVRDLDAILGESLARLAQSRPLPSGHTAQSLASLLVATQLSLALRVRAGLSRDELQRVVAPAITLLRT